LNTDTDLNLLLA